MQRLESLGLDVKLVGVERNVEELEGPVGPGRRVGPEARDVVSQGTGTAAIAAPSGPVTRPRTAPAETAA